MKFKREPYLEAHTEGGGQLDEDITLEETEIEIEEAEGEIEVDEEPDETEEPTPQAIKVKYNHEEMELPYEEAVVHIQKGMNYDKAVERAKREALAEAERKQQEFDNLFARTIKGELNPHTGRPIETYDDFMEWTKAEEARQLEDAGLSPDFIEQAIANNPVIQQATAIIKQNQMNQSRIAADREIAEIQKLNPKIKSVEDLYAERKDDDVFNALVQGGMPLSRAYEVVSKTPQRKEDTKSHMQSVGGGGTGNAIEKEIPGNLLEMWKDAFPDDKPAELRARYNRSIKEQGE